MSIQQEPQRMLKQLSMLTSDQKQAVDVALQGQKLIVGKMGSGKTIIAATAIARLLDKCHLNKVLIVTTPKIANTVWQEEFAAWEHTAHISVGLASGAAKPEERIAAAKDDEIQVVVTTFNLLPFFREHNLYKYFEGLLIDETTKLTQAAGRHTMAIKNASKKFVWKLGLTGTPVDEGLYNLYTQLLLIDGGKTFGTRKQSFMLKWFYPTDYKQLNWEIKPHLKDEFLEALKTTVYIIPDYRHELPKLQETHLHINPSYELKRAYCHFCSTSALPNMVSPTAATDTQKQLQLASGFYYDDAGEVNWIDYSRIESALDLADSSVVDGNVIIVFNYIAEKDKLLEFAPEAVVLSARNDVDVVDRWNKKEIPILLVHPASASHGIQLQFGGHTIIWLSNQWSLDKKNQLNARVWRRGQENPVEVYYFHLLGVDTRVDEKLAGKEKNDIFFNQLINQEEGE